MDTYPTQNPNEIRQPSELPHRKKKHPILKAFQILFLTFLSVLLIVSLTVTITFAAFRSRITPEFIYNYTKELDYLSLPLPADGQFTTVFQMLQDGSASVGLPTSEKDIQILFDQLSVSTILSMYAQDFSTWLLEDGPRPQPSSEQIAAIALSGVDDSILTIFSFFGDPVEVVSEMLSGPISVLNSSEIFDQLEPVRLVLSSYTLYFAVSVCMMLSLLLFLLCCCRVRTWVIPMGIDLLVVGAGLSAGMVFLPMAIQKLTQVYAPYAQVFLEPMLAYLRTASLWLCGIGVGFLVLGILVWRICRSRCMKLEKTGYAENITNMPQPPENPPQF